jgi:phosphoglycerate kinase
MLKLNSISNSTVLVRVNYDLPLPISTERIDDSLSTLETLFENNNKIIILTHWGRPKDNDPKLSTKKLATYIEESLGRTVVYINQFKSFEDAKDIIKESKEKIFLLENTRYNPDEKSKDSKVRLELAKSYAYLGDAFVDEAFPVSHRDEATNCEIKTKLPFCYGLSYQHEVENLDKIKANPKHPFVAIMGGAKLETKLPLLNKILPKVDKILVGGLLAFTFLQAKKNLGQNIPEIFNSIVEDDFVSVAEEIMKNHGDKIVLPIDLEYGESEGKKYGYDIGTATIDLFKSEIAKAQTIFWNGPMGFCEKKPFDKGTIEIATAIAANKTCFSAIGGGDTGSAVPADIESQFNFVSMGGGATLEYLAK